MSVDQAEEVREAEGDGGGVSALFAALEVRGLWLTYSATRRASAVEALKGVNLRIMGGQAVALLGPNGSGKSTLMKIVSGLIVSDAGEVSVFGSSEVGAIRRRISVVFQTNGLDPHLTVEENLRCQASLYGLTRDDADARINEELDRAGLTEKRHAYVKALSLGMARRVDLVRALLHHPRLLLLDEPTVGLDPVARAHFLEEVERRRLEYDLTILMSTHLIDEADRFERCVFIHRGEVAADDEPRALRHRLGGLILTVHGHAKPEESIAGVDGRLEWRRVSGGFIAITDSENTEVVSRIASGLAREGRAFTMAPPTLADVFADLTGASLSKRAGEESDGDSTSSVSAA